MTFRNPASLALCAQNVSFAYPGGRNVFQDFSLETHPGEFVALLGPSGCGKTTLLNLLSGFLQPTAGTISISGMPVTPELASLGYVFQTPNLFPWLSVLENVRFGLKMAGRLSAAEQREKAQHYLALVGLEDTADELPHRLSGGMRQRVALARTLALEPRVLLMDEPFAALDAITRININEELLRIWSALGQTIIFITHDVDEAVFLADRVFMLGLPPNGIDSETLIDLSRPRNRLTTRSSPRFVEYGDHLMHRIGAITGAGRVHPLTPSGARKHALS
jgi:NitT/TauT family transport system ATP-binding protein